MVKHKHKKSYTPLVLPVFVVLRNRTIPFITQKVAVLGVGPTNMYGSNERVNIHLLHINF